MFCALLFYAVLLQAFPHFILPTISLKGDVLHSFYKCGRERFWFLKLDMITVILKYRKKNFIVDKGHNFKCFCNEIVNKFGKVARNSLTQIKKIDL